MSCKLIFRSLRDKVSLEATMALRSDFIPAEGTSSDGRLMWCVVLKPFSLIVSWHGNHNNYTTQDSKKCHPIVWDISSQASNFLFSLAHWARAQPKCVPTKFKNCRLGLVHGKQNLRAACPKGRLDFQFFFKPCNVTDVMSMLNQAFSRV